MIWALGKILISASTIAFCSWLAGKRPALAGFVMALPLVSLIALPLTQAEFHDSAKTVEFAQSILLSVPLSLTFFLPFLFADRLKLSFWGLYGSGMLCLFISFGIHQWITRLRV